MALVADAKKQVIGKYRIHKNDSGSPEVQVALLTERIRHITEHLKGHMKDHATRRGLLQMVGRRSSLLKYLTRKDRDRYLKLIERLGLRK